jgi:hypothetical protein
LAEFQLPFAEAAAVVAALPIACQSGSLHVGGFDMAIVTQSVTVTDMVC